MARNTKAQETEDNGRVNYLALWLLGEMAAKMAQDESGEPLRIYSLALQKAGKLLEQLKL